MVATGVTAEGKREILGVDVVSARGWSRLDGPPAGPGGPGVAGGPAGDLRRPRGLKNFPPGRSADQP